MKIMDANIMCLSETAIAWEIPVVRNAIAGEFKRSDAYTTVTGSTSMTKSFSVVNQEVQQSSRTTIGPIGR